MSTITRTPKSFNTETFRVDGMTCPFCVGKVKKAITRLEGVESAKVNLFTKKVQIKYQPELIQLPKIRESVHEAGYELQALLLSKKQIHHEEKV